MLVTEFLEIRAINESLLPSQMAQLKESATPYITVENRGKG